MSRRRPRLSECKTMDDFVRGGFAQVVSPATDVGFRSYGIGRQFVAASYTESLIPDMTSATDPSGVASASSTLNEGVWPAWQAFDRSAAGWLAGAGTTGWLQYQFPAAHIVTRYAVTSYWEAAPNVRAPKAWTFQGSNDGSAWTVLDTQANIVDWAALPNTRKVFDIPNLTAYAYYRLDITASNDATYVGVGELEMMETSVSATNLVFTDLVTITSAGVVAAGTNVAYARNSSGTLYGPAIVTPTAKSAGWQTDVTAYWHDNRALFDAFCAAGDVLIPLGGDSRAYRKTV